jgi:DNA-binding NarL/FixJ family response regulator
MDQMGTDGSGVDRSGMRQDGTVPTRRIRVLLVDDDPWVCAGLQLVLSSAEDVEVVSAVHDGDEVPAAVRAHRPDVVLMDVRMRRVDGITATRELRRLPNPPRVVVLTTFEEDSAVLQAVEVGAAGFLLKTAGPAEILAAVRDAAAGAAPISARSARALFDHVAADPAASARRAAADALSRLSDREREVVVAVARGWSNADIARELFLSEATVKTHLSSAQAKLGCRNRVEVAVLVERAGLLHV